MKTTKKTIRRIVLGAGALILALTLFAGLSLTNDSENQTEKSRFIQNAKILDLDQNHSDTYLALDGDATGNSSLSKCGEGKCGDGKCGGEKEKETAKSDTEKKDSKCGDGKCGEGESKDSNEDKKKDK